MNLGAFMNPEFPIFSTTLCYLERDDAYLMLHRIKKQDDYNHDKWIGVGGKFERFESPEDCLLREVKEETGLTLKRFRARGLLTFIWGNMTEFIHLYTADEWTGEMVQGDACREGVLEWVPKDKAAELPIWEGDKIFFRLLNEERPYFSLKLVYEGDTLTQAVLDGKRIVCAPSAARQLQADGSKRLFTARPLIVKRQRRNDRSHSGVAIYKNIFLLILSERSGDNSKS